jgi:hypothetical protein
VRQRVFARGMRLEQYPHRLCYGTIQQIRDRLAEIQPSVAVEQSDAQDGRPRLDRFGLPGISSELPITGHASRRSASRVAERNEVTF